MPNSAPRRPLERGYPTGRATQSGQLDMATRVSSGRSGHGVLLELAQSWVCQLPHPPLAGVSRSGAARVRRALGRHPVFHRGSQVGGLSPAREHAPGVACGSPARHTEGQVRRCGALTCTARWPVSGVHEPGAGRGVPSRAKPPSPARYMGGHRYARTAGGIGLQWTRIDHRRDF